MIYKHRFFKNQNDKLLTLTLYVTYFDTVMLYYDVIVAVINTDGSY
jgi:hypothetical protein